MKGAAVDCSCELGSTVTSTGGGGGTVTAVTATGPLSSSGGTTPDISLTGVVPVANGGTGASAFTAGSVIFSNGTTFTQDNTNFFWNDSTNLLTTANLFSPSFVGDLNPDGVTTLRQVGNLFVWGTIRGTRISPSNNVVITGDISSGTNTITNVSAADIAKLGQAAAAFEVSNANFPVGTTTTSAVGTTVTVGQLATGSAIGASITFVGGAWAVRTENQTGAINSGSVSFRSGGTVTGNSGAVAFQSGAVTGAGTSGSVTSSSGTATTVASGAYSARSGNVSGAGGISGIADFSSGSTTTGASGVVLLRSGNTSAGGTSGAVSIGSGTSSGITGITTIATGASSGGGTTGSIELFTGTTAGTRGVVRSTASAFHLTAVPTTGVQPLHFFDTDNTNFVAFKAAGTVPVNVTWELPSADGTSGQALSTNGAGILSWASFANAALSNLAATAVNVSIIPALDATIDLGSGALRWATIFTQTLSTNTIETPAGIDLDIYPDTEIASIHGNGTGAIIRLTDGADSNFVAFKAPTTVPSPVTWTLPDADGTVGQVLRTDGAALLSWVDNTGLPEVNVTKVANYTILSGDSIIFADTTGGAFTLTLPTPTALAGKIYRIYDSGGTLSTNNLSLAPSGAEKISGLAATKVFSTDWGGWEVTTNGTDWFVK